MSITLNLSDAKARFSDVVRSVRKSGEDVFITVDGEPAVRIAALSEVPRDLKPSEAAMTRALFEAIQRIPRAEEPFDAVQLVAEGRR